MEDLLRKRIKEFPDDHLIAEYAHNHSEYTSEALDCMRQELTSRNLTVPEDSLGERDSSHIEDSDFDTTRFAGFEASFSARDLYLVLSILRDKGIRFITAPREQTEDHEAEDPFFSVSVQEDLFEEGKKAVEEHYVIEKDCYCMKKLPVKDRLKSFSFHEQYFSEIEQHEPVDVSLTDSESQILAKYTGKLIQEADEIENRDGRTLFYYDNLEETERKIASSTHSPLLRIDLLTIIEVLQVYHEEKDFPHSMDEVSEVLLGFLTSS